MTAALFPRNRLLTGCKPVVSGSCSTPTVNAAYAYDPLGRRTHKSGAGVTERYFLNDGDDEVVEYDGSKNPVAFYVPGPAIDEPVVRSAPNGSGYTHEYFHTNHQGSVIGMSDDSGNLVEGPFLYDAYGNCFKGSTACGSLANTVPYKFTGRRLDPETGLYYYRARCYSPTLGRFCQTDPVGYTADLNLYTYVGNDPVNRTDPKGLYDCSGNKDDCAAINKFVSAVGTAASHLDPNSDAGKKVNAVVQYLGKAGDKNGVTINATQISGKAVALAGPNNTIKIDVGKAKDITTNGFGRANPSMSAAALRNAQGGATIGHEARHEIDANRGGWPTTKAQEFRTELNAYTTEGDVYTGFGLRNGVSNPAEISSAAGQSTNLWCREAQQLGATGTGC